MKSTSVTITVLAENTAQGMGLLGEHGLRLWIETAETCVLFDTGQGLTLPHDRRTTFGVAQNTVRLSIGIEPVEQIVDDLKRAMDAI